MNFEDLAPKPFDPNAPKVLDVAVARTMVRTAERHLRQPMGQHIVDMAAQLGSALDALASVDTRVFEAQNQATRFKQEAEVANAEVKTMQSIVAKAREDLTKALEENKAMKDEIAKYSEAGKDVVALPAPPVKKKPGPKAKVVQ